MRMEVLKAGRLESQRGSGAARGTEEEDFTIVGILGRTGDRTTSSTSSH
jgi:hypothetical protein